MFVSGISSVVGYTAFFIEGFDPATKTETISEVRFEGMRKENFWDSLESKGAEKLVIICKDGKKVIYEKGFFNRLLDTKPALADLTSVCTVEFLDRSWREEPKAKLFMCGKTVENLIGDIQSQSVPLSTIAKEDFQGVLDAIENEVVDISTYSEDVRLAMNYLDFHPAGVPEGVHGKKDWNARGVDVGAVRPLPKELLEALNEPCPISKDGSKMIDTHVILWMPPTLNGEPITVDTLEKMATADAFGKNEIGYEYCYDLILTDAVINQPLERGYWLAQYKKPVAGGRSFADQQKFITDNCPGYEVPKIREVIAASVMQYGCSGGKKERILAREDRVRYSRCEEPINGYRVIVGALASSGLHVNYDIGDYDSVGVCPVRKFF